MGYSKLGKAALISKLAELNPSYLPPSSVHNTRSKTDASFSTSGAPQLGLGDPPAIAGAGPGHMGPPSLPTSRGGNMVSAGTHISQTSDTSQLPPPCLSGGRGIRLSPSVAPHSAPISKHEISLDQARDYPLAKRPRVAASSTVQTVGEVALPSRPPDSARLTADDCRAPDPPLSGSPGSALVPRINEGPGRQLVDSQTQIVSMSRNRFKPLTITRPPSVMQHNRKEAQPSSGSLVDGSTEVMAQPTLLWHLEFPAPPDPPLLHAITYPPPLSQRKLIQRWVIILSGLSNKERLQCCSVSRLIRYAGKCGCLNM